MAFLKRLSVALYAASIPVTSASTLQKRADDGWAQLLKDQFPKNEEMCTLQSNSDSSAVSGSKAGLYLAYYFTDRGGKMDKWLEDLHRNATTDQTSVGEFGCTQLGSNSCTGNGDSDCLNYNPAAFGTIRRQATQIVGAMDQLLTLMSINTTVNLVGAGDMVQEFLSQENDNKKDIQTCDAS